MKIYQVEEIWEWEGSAVIATYATYEKAAEHRDRMNMVEGSKWSGLSYEVEEREVTE